MKKTIIISISTLILALTSIAKAEIGLSGYQEFFAGSVDQSIASGNGNHGNDMSGMGNGNYTTITATANATLDSGIEVSGVSTMYARDCQGDRTGNCGVVNFNSVAFSSSFGTVTVGETFDVGASEYSRMTVGPVGEPDGGQLTQFYTTSAANNYGAANETQYADNSVKIKYNSNVYSGFSFAVGFTPFSGEDGANTDAQDTAAGTVSGNNWDGGYSDILHVIGKYTMEMDGVGLTLAYGQITGNAGRIAGADYNDLEESVYSIYVTYGGFSADYRKNEAGDSGREKNTNAGNDEGTSMCGQYDMGNISVAACEVDTNFTDANNRENSSMTRTYSLNYQLGGGVGLGLVYFDADQIANGATQTEVDGVVSRLTFGF